MDCSDPAGVQSLPEIFAAIALSRDVPVTEPQTPHASVQSAAAREMEAAVEEQMAKSSTGKRIRFQKMKG